MVAKKKLAKRLFPFLNHFGRILLQSLQKLVQRQNKYTFLITFNLKRLHNVIHDFSSVKYKWRIPQMGGSCRGRKNVSYVRVVSVNSRRIFSSTGSGANRRMPVCSPRDQYVCGIPIYLFRYWIIYSTYIPYTRSCPSHLPVFIPSMLKNVQLCWTKLY